MLIKRSYLPNCTLAELICDDLELATIERPWKNNAPYISCIPEGEYLCVRYSSKKYPNTFEITNVPGRSKILFHKGNYARNVKGCVAVAMRIAPKRFQVNQSKKGFGLFMEYLEETESFNLFITHNFPEYP